ncbi:hypothetical protein ACFL3F_05045, partial [Planctomycetota bacterium]
PVQVSADESFAFARTGMEWVTIGFYESVHRCSGTQLFLSEFDKTDPSIATFSLAHHTIAAYQVDAHDKTMFRQSLIRSLSRVDDNTAGFPVLALGAAIWALAQTGPLDSTPVDDYPVALGMWKGIKLHSLRSILLDQQVPSNQEFGGSFYTRFDHSSGGLDVYKHGYVDEAVYCTLGLIAAYNYDPNTHTAGTHQCIEISKNVLLTGISENGVVHEHLMPVGEVRYMFGGRIIQALEAWIELAESELDSLS